ncbi:MAG: hypothetical protein AAGD32_17545 [Planctomycetota bacterium]
MAQKPPPNDPPEDLLGPALMNLKVGYLSSSHLLGGPPGYSTGEQQIQLISSYITDSMPPLEHARYTVGFGGKLADHGQGAQVSLAGRGTGDLIGLALTALRETYLQGFGESPTVLGLESWGVHLPMQRDDPRYQGYMRWAHCLDWNEAASPYGSDMLPDAMVTEIFTDRVTAMIMLPSRLPQRNCYRAIVCVRKPNEAECTVDEGFFDSGEYLAPPKRSVEQLDTTQDPDAVEDWLDDMDEGDFDPTFGGGDGDDDGSQQGVPPA